MRQKYKVEYSICINLLLTILLGCSIRTIENANMNLAHTKTELLSAQNGGGGAWVDLILKIHKRKNQF